MSNIEPTTRPHEPTFSSPSAPTRPDAVARDAIDAANARFRAAFAAADAAALAACYTADGQALPANSGAVIGQAAIAEFWAGVIASGIADVRLETAEVEARGDMAAESGRYTLFGADGGAVDEGKYVVVWRRDDGGWKMHRDIWTTSRPASPT